MRTQVTIGGAGPAGLTLAPLLHRSHIESVIVENRSREYVIERVRAGVLEQATRDLIVAAGLRDRLQRERVPYGLSVAVATNPEHYGAVVGGSPFVVSVFEDVVAVEGFLLETASLKPG